DGFHTGDERCADCTHARNQNAQLPGWCLDFDAFLYHFTSSETGAVYYEPRLSLINSGRFTACSPIGKQEIAIHSGNHFEPDVLRANGFAFANIGAAPEHLSFDLRHHI